jgi:nucleotide-binding universal stress UspA family protein
MKSFRRILCPVDFSATSRHAFEHALMLARALGAEVSLVHVIGEVPLLTAYTGTPEESILMEIQKYAQRELDGMLAGVDTGGVTLHSRLIRASEHGGSTDKAILAFAEKEGADLIVMGKHGRGALDYFFFGSVTDRVIRIATRPVVVIPSPAASEAKAGS